MGLASLPTLHAASVGLPHAAERRYKGSSALVARYAEPLLGAAQHAAMPMALPPTSAATPGWRRGGDDGLTPSRAQPTASTVLATIKAAHLPVPPPPLALALPGTPSPSPSPRPAPVTSAQREWHAPSDNLLIEPDPPLRPGSASLAPPQLQGALSLALRPLASVALLTASRDAFGRGRAAAATPSHASRAERASALSTATTRPSALAERPLLMIARGQEVGRHSAARPAELGTAGLAVGVRIAGVHDPSYGQSTDSVFTVPSSAASPPSQARGDGAGAGAEPPRRPGAEERAALAPLVEPLPSELGLVGSGAARRRGGGAGGRESSHRHRPPVVSLGPSNLASELASDLPRRAESREDDWRGWLPVPSLPAPGD
jgi:hypothetical protein